MGTTAAKLGTNAAEMGTTAAEMGPTAAIVGTSDAPAARCAQVVEIFDAQGGASGSIVAASAAVRAGSAAIGEANAAIAATCDARPGRWVAIEGGRSAGPCARRAIVTTPSIAPAQRPPLHVEGRVRAPSEVARDRASFLVAALAITTAAVSLHGAVNTRRNPWIPCHTPQAMNKPGDPSGARLQYPDQVSRPVEIIGRFMEIARVPERLLLHDVRSG